MSESDKTLGEFLLEKREENKDEMDTGLKQKFIGDFGELFALKYLKKLFKRNNINYNVKPHNYDKEDYDLEIYGNGRSYKVEVKTSRSARFHSIHFNNDFEDLLLIWHPSYDKIYFAILTKEEAKEIATPENTNREDEDNWAIHTISIFDETNERFLKRLSEILELNEELEDLEENEKIYLIEKTEEEVIKENKNVDVNDFNGETYQQWFFDYLSNYVDDVELMPRGYKFDIDYKGKGIEIKYSSMYNDEEFQFYSIKIDNFDYILFIGFNPEENKFYFEIKSREEFINWLEEHDNNFQQNGNKIHVPKSFFRYNNDFDFENFDNYIENH